MIETISAANEGKEKRSSADLSLMRGPTASTGTPNLVISTGDPIFPPLRTSSRGMKFNSALDSLEGAAMLGAGSVKS